MLCAEQRTQINCTISCKTFINSTDPHYFHRFHVTNVITEKKIKVDGQITLCFEQSLCSEAMHFFDLPMSYDNCSAVGEEAAFKGLHYWLYSLRPFF